MSDALPQVTRTYQNHHLDSTRWQEYDPRPGDVIITTSYKAGTTWTQQILFELFYGQQPSPPDFGDVNPWPDARFLPISREALRTMINGIEGRRFIKSHLPLDGLPYYPDVQYVIVARDPRDVFMSFFHHYSRYADEAMKMFNAPDIVGDPLPDFVDDPRALWRNWITRGWFPWESEGYPFWGNMAHTQSYWNWRHLPNFYFMHYNDMLSDIDGTLRHLFKFLGENPSPEHFQQIIDNTRFETVKARAAEQDASDESRPTPFKGGRESFFFKGTNGRWRDVLTEDDLQLYEAAKARVLTPDCAAWLEKGGKVA